MVPEVTNFKDQEQKKLVKEAINKKIEETKALIES